MVVFFYNPEMSGGVQNVTSDLWGYKGGNELKMTTLAEDQYEGNPYFQDEIRKVFLLILENYS